MSSSIEFLLQKYGISPKTSPSLHSTSPLHQSSAPDLRISPLKSSDLSTTLELDLQRAKSEIFSLKAQLTSLMLQKEKEFTLKSCDLESELKILSTRNRSLEEQIMFLKTQLEFYETENKRIAEQHSIEKENCTLQLESLKRQLQYKHIEGSSNISSAKMEKEENRMLRDQLLQMKTNEQSLLSELETLKKHLETEKNKTQELQNLKEIELKATENNYHLNLQQFHQDTDKTNQLCASLNSALSEKDKKIAELENALRLSEEARQALKKQQNATQDFIKDVVSVNEQLVDSLQKGKKNSRSKSFKEKSKTSRIEEHKKKVSIPSYLDQENKLQSTILALEEEIQEINNDYKRLLAKSDDGTSDYLKYKEEIDKLAKLLEDKAKSLFAAKRRFSSLVREKIINKAIN